MDYEVGRLGEVAAKFGRDRARIKSLLFGLGMILAGVACLAAGVNQVGGASAAGILAFIGIAGIVIGIAPTLQSAVELVGSKRVTLHANGISVEKGAGTTWSATWNEIASITSSRNTWTNGRVRDSHRITKIDGTSETLTQASDGAEQVVSAANNAIAQRLYDAAVVALRGGVDVPYGPVLLGPDAVREVSSTSVVIRILPLGALTDVRVESGYLRISTSSDEIRANCGDVPNLQILYTLLSNQIASFR